MKKSTVERLFVIHDVFFFDYEKAVQFEDGKDFPRPFYCVVNEDERETDGNGALYQDGFYLYDSIDEIIEEYQNQGYKKNKNILVSEFEQNQIKL